MQRGGEDRREGQINFVVFQLGQFIDEECADGVAVETVSAAEMIDDLRGQLARTFQFGGEDFEEWQLTEYPVRARRDQGGISSDGVLRFAVRQTAKFGKVNRYAVAVAARFFRPAIMKARYSMRRSFISLRGTMASMRPWSSRNSAV